MDFHKLVHEMMHAISDNKKGKRGLFQAFIKDNKMEFYGYTLNEASTEYLTSIILSESFYGYTIEIKLVLQIIMEIIEINDSELLKIYIKDEEWLNDSIKERYSGNNKNALLDLVILYDNRFPQTRKDEFNPNEILNNLLTAIYEKILLNKELNNKKVYDLLLELIEHYKEYYDLQDYVYNKFFQIGKILLEENQPNF